MNKGCYQLIIRCRAWYCQITIRRPGVGKDNRAANRADGPALREYDLFTCSEENCAVATLSTSNGMMTRNSGLKNYDIDK